MLAELYILSQARFSNLATDPCVLHSNKATVLLTQIINCEVQIKLHIKILDFEGAMIIQGNFVISAK